MYLQSVQYLRVFHTALQDFQISTIGCHCKLQINDIYPEDEGTYSCRAVNSLGEAVSTCYVTVEGELEDEIWQ